MWPALMVKFNCAGGAFENCSQGRRGLRHSVGMHTHVGLARVTAKREYTRSGTLCLKLETMPHVNFFKDAEGTGAQYN